MPLGSSRTSTGPDMSDERMQTPSDLVEERLAGDGWKDIETMEELAAELRDYRVAAHQWLIEALIDEDDRDERVELADYYRFLLEDLSRAHQTFGEHIRKLGVAGDLGLR
jgi:hypothetical protein